MPVHDEAAPRLWPGAVLDAPYTVPLQRRRSHSLRLSASLLAAGYPHSVLPLSGVTHMTPQEVVAENLLLLQVAFLREALAKSAM